MTIGEKFAAIRNEVGISATAFGKPMAIKKAHLSTIENGKSQPSERVIKLMIQHYRVSEKWWEAEEGPIILEEKQEKPHDDPITELVLNAVRRTLAIYETESAKSEAASVILKAAEGLGKQGEEGLG